MTDLEDRRKPEWHFRDLFTDHRTGKLRETLLWSNVGKAAALFWFSWECYRGTDSEWLWLVVMGALVFHELVSRVINQVAPNWVANKLGIHLDSNREVSDVHTEKTTLEPAK